MKLVVFFVLLLTGCSPGGHVNKETQLIISPESKSTDDKTFDYTPSEYTKIAFSYLEQEKTRYKIENPKEQLKAINERIDKLETKHVKFNQIYKNIPIWGSEIIVHVDANDKVYLVSGNIMTGLPKLVTVPSISSNKASSVLMKNEQWGGNHWQIKESALNILKHDNHYYLVYHMTLTKGLKREFIFMDANNGKIIRRISGTYTNN